ncbi:Acyltransferase [Rubripirellula obstinata]|uniref:Acyltransferase n=1 Tax=Rubripirellula obstinata TaxID=406547 RepID=A0A5B1CJ61_9BACT|nr:1-acyl-sn-glycerol-3-phosphate acyltransferase [Rubripirellula obstinata]KAA1260301.1 Acyltransferase [Rubripirellula obstinata]
MSVVLTRPYEFVGPHRGNLWPSLIQALRIVDWYLAKKEGVVDYDLRGMHHWQQSLQRGDGILLAPNHCRYADPLVIGKPARQLGTHVFAMASWHLFNTGFFDSFAIRKMGGFSIHREASDRQSLETAISILATAERPLILFPEGTTNRTNDVLKPLLDGVAFIARTAARRRSKVDQGKVVMHPMALKYLCVGDAKPWAEQQLSQMETQLGWSGKNHQGFNDRTVLQRTVALAEAMLSLKEIEHFGHSVSGPLPNRRDALIDHLLTTGESRLALGDDKNDKMNVRDRVRAIRSEVVSRQFGPRDQSVQHNVASFDQASLQQEADNANLAQELLSYPDSYLQGDEVTDTRIVETIQRMQETFLGKANVEIPLKVVIQCDEAIEVPAAKAPRGETDPLMQQLDQRLRSMVNALSTEARTATQAGMA